MTLSRQKKNTNGNSLPPPPRLFQISAEGGVVQLTVPCVLVFWVLLPVFPVATPHALSLSLAWRVSVA